MRKINLLYIITKLELGGAQKQLLSLITSLDQEKFNIFLFTAQEGLLIADAFSIKGLVLERSKWLERPVNPLKDFLALIEICRFVKRNHIDIVHTHSSKAGILGRLAAKLARAKLIIHTVHGWSFSDFQPFFTRRIFIWLERLTARFSSKMIVVSDFDRLKGLNNQIGTPDQYRRICYGINYADFAGSIPEIKRELGVNSGELAVGMIACLKPQKAPRDFVKLAFLVSQNIPNVKFILAGDGILRKPVKKMINRLGLQNKVMLIGWRRDIPRILSALDVFVLTSLWEGLPIAALEAMASSLPVAVTRTGGVEEIITENKNGFLASCGNTEEMSEKLAILLKDLSLRKSIGQNAKNSLGDNFRLESMVKATQRLYEELSAGDFN